MGDEVAFAVRGLPTTQGSLKLVRQRNTGRQMLVPDDSTALRQWRKEVGKMARLAMGIRNPWRGPVRSTLVFVLPRPRTLSKAEWAERGGWPAVKPDRDKLERAVNDACTGIVYVDDAQIVDGSVTKRYAEDNEEPGVIAKFERLVTPPGDQLRLPEEAST